MTASRRVVLVGCGAVAEHLYGPALRRIWRHGGIKDVYLVDPDPSRTMRLRMQFPTAGVSRSLHAVPQDHLAGSLCIVATPHSLHARTTAEAFAGGAHVLCEKPMALTTDECSWMLEAAETARRVLAIGHFRRFYPVSRVIGEWLRQRRWGRLVSFRCLEGEIYEWPATSASFIKRELAGGGVLMDSGVHTLDLLLSWLGPLQVTEYRDDGCGGLEGNCTIRLATSDGIPGFVQLSRDTVLANRYLFECESGWFMYSCDDVDHITWGFKEDTRTFHTHIRDYVGRGFDLLPVCRPAFASLGDCFEAQLINVLEAIEGRGVLVCSGENARAAIDLVERCYAQRRPLAQAWLPADEQEALSRWSAP